MWLKWLLLVSAPGVALGCGAGCPPLDDECTFAEVEQPTSATVALRTVTDADTGEVLCAGCDGCQSVVLAAGQRVFIEDLLKSAKARSRTYDGIPGVPFGCAADGQETDPNVTVRPQGAVPGPHCWRVPGEGNAARIVELEVIPLEGAPQPAVDTHVPGQGYRYLIEVLLPGVVTLEPSGACDHIDEESIVDVMCGESNRCDGSLACKSAECEACRAASEDGCHVPQFCRGGCVIVREPCDPTTMHRGGCPPPFECVEERCVWELGS
jgi:hypothetical protein